MNRAVFKNLRESIENKDTLVCCGLDPDIHKMPLQFKNAPSAEDAIYDFLKTIIDLTADHVCAYKIQKAFFDLYPGAKTLLGRVITYVRVRVPGTLVIVDCKVGDIDNTMRAYLQSILVDVNADGIVLNPYMGSDVWSPLSAYPNKLGAILVRTSNPESHVIQEAKLCDNRPLWRFVLDLVVTEWHKGLSLIPILSSNSTDDLHDLRAIIPDEMPIFLAGVGAQGGQIQCIRSLTDSHGGGLLVNSSRRLLYPYAPDDPDWERIVQSAVIQLKNSINENRQ